MTCEDVCPKPVQIKKLIRKSYEKWPKTYRLENGVAVPAMAEKE
jgi:hypothetical protein